MRPLNFSPNLVSPNNSGSSLPGKIPWRIELYIPKHFAETDPQVLRAFIRRHPLGAWVAPGDHGLEVNHIPFLIDPNRGEFGTLMGHVARANAVWRSVDRSKSSVVIFQGPEAYISPSWYASKAIDGKVVPTWNYAVVHTHGIPQIMEDKEWLRELVTKLTVEHENRREKPWQVTDAPVEYVSKLLEAIVGVEIPITKIEGKWKASQNRPGDVAGIVSGLREPETEGAESMARIMEYRAETR